MLQRTLALLRWILPRSHGTWSLVVATTAIIITVINMHISASHREDSLLQPARAVVVEHGAKFYGILAARDYHQYDKTLTTEEYVQLSKLYAEIRNAYIVARPYVGVDRRNEVDEILTSIERPGVKVKNIPLIGMRMAVSGIQAALFDSGIPTIEALDLLPSDAGMPPK